jgi:hypothetical protein
MTAGSAVWVANAGAAGTASRQARRKEKRTGPNRETMAAVRTGRLVWVVVTRSSLFQHRAIMHVESGVLVHISLKNS